MKLLHVLSVIIVAISNLPLQAYAEVTDIRLGLLGAGPEVFAYEISVLKLALHHADAKSQLTIVDLEMPQERALVELETGRANFNVFFTGFSANREKRFHQIDIPLSRGILGHRIFITTKAFLDDLAETRTLGSLKKFAVVGSGTGWPDTEIFQANGFDVVASDYESLWRMLSAGRINTFNRGIHEAFVEHQQRSQQDPELVVDPSVMIRYRFDYLFYVRKNNQRVAEIIETGLRNAYENGAFLEHFNSHPMIQKAMMSTAAHERLIFDIDNPLLTDRQRNIPEAYWHQY